jgi:hypothetical protein
MLTVSVPYSNFSGLGPTQETFLTRTNYTGHQISGSALNIDP